MIIRIRNNGEWCMEHQGVEAPYIVTCPEPGRFEVFFADDEEGPCFATGDADTCARLALEHFQRL